MKKLKLGLILPIVFSFTFPYSKPQASSFSQREIQTDQMQSNVALQGLRKTYATYFQNCRVLDFTDRDPQLLLKKDSTTIPQSCVDRSEIDLGYLAGGVSRVVTVDEKNASMEWDVISALASWEQAFRPQA